MLATDIEPGIDVRWASSASVPEGSTGLFEPDRLKGSPFTRHGSLLLSERLAIDPFGSLYRGISHREGIFARHMLVRLFSGEFTRSARIGNRLHEACTPLLRLGYQQALGSHFILENDTVPAMACQYHPGRSLHQVLRRAEERGMELPPQLTLFILRELAQGVSLMHQAGLPHGILNPHGIWIGFQGLVRVLDAPLAQVLSEVMPRTPDARAALAPYLRFQETDPMRLDLFQLGAVLHLMLAFKPLKDTRNPASCWSRAQRWTPEGAEPLAPAIHALEGNLLGLLPEQLSLEALRHQLDQMLFFDEHPAYAFELARWMQRLFSREWRAEARALDIERAWNFKPLVQAS